jgi:hypothetical protein
MPDITVCTVAFWQKTTTTSPRVYAVYCMHVHAQCLPKAMVSILFQGVKSYFCDDQALNSAHLLEGSFHGNS